jgi:tetratricopeptide (TPR) repeat protein
MGMKATAGRRGVLRLSFLGGTFLLALVAGAVLLASRPGRNPVLDPVDQLKVAKVAFADGEFALAHDLLGPLLAAGPEDPKLQLFMGKVLIELGNLAAARATFDAVHKAAPDLVESLLGLAVCHERAGESHLAIACLKRASEMKKGDWKILHDLAMAEYRSGDPMAALFTARQSLRARKGQEDLSKIMDEIGVNRQARSDLARPNPRHPQGFDPFEMPDTRPPDPWEGLPRPGFTDPGLGTPHPGRGGPR